MFNYNIQLKIF